MRAILRATAARTTSVSCQATLTVLVVSLAAIGLRAPMARAAELMSADAPAANVFCNGIRQQDEIWLVNVRPLCGCCEPEMLAKNIQVESYVATGDGGRRCWQSADMGGLTSANPSVPTVIFVHGNQISPGDAKQEGVALYRRMVWAADSPTPIRYVIFSWPSSKISGLLRDVRVKALRTRPAGCQLAWVIDQLPGETPVELIGFSFGARIITGALHILGGGDLGGLTLAARQHPDRQPMNVVLFAAALNSDWLCPGHYHGQAMTQVDRMMLLNNCNDMAMEYYRFSATCGNPQALGLCGPTCMDAAGAAKIRQRDLSRWVDQHDLMCYICAPGVPADFWQYSHADQSASASVSPNASPTPMPANN
ncbi:MAG TPA: hypothetical protein VGM76_07480 [Lacipirellulaceae bacterium]